MKKRVLLLITLVVSLFIYSSRVNAIVMWMQCTEDAEGKLKGNDDYQKYNTFAVINEIDSSIHTKRIAYIGGLGDDGIKQKNFFSYKGPTFISNIGGVGKTVFTNQNICWYESGYDDSCPSDSGPFYSMSTFNDGVCPAAAYEIDGGNAIDGDFLVLSGAMSAAQTEVLDGYEFALYKYNLGADVEGWIMEAYNNSGVYGFTSVTPISDVFNIDNLEKIEKDDNIGDTCFSDNLNHSAFERLFCQYFHIRGKQNDENDIMESDFDYGSRAVGSYVDWIQHAEMIKIYYTGRNYFKLSSAIENPQVLIANVGEYHGKLKNRAINDSLHTYNKNGTVWNEIDEWVNANSSDTSELGIILKKFESGEYANLVDISEKVNDAVSSGKDYDLDNDIDYDGTINKLNNALNDIKTVVPSSKSGQPGISFTKYRLASDSELLSTDENVKSKIINNCIADGFMDSAIESASDYVGCKTFGYPFTYVLNEDKGYDGVYDLNDKFPSFNGKIAETVYRQVINDQINKSTDISANLVNYKNDLKKHLTTFSRYAYFIKSKYGDFLTNDQKQSFETIIESYLEYARDAFQIEIILDCGTLIGEDFIEQIEKFANIVKIIVPILLIGFGILDFTKAIFAQNTDEIKKAQKKFLMRILIAILFFLLPVLVRLLLSIANKAWSFISPNTCDIKW